MISACKSVVCLRPPLQITVTLFTVLLSRVHTSLCQGTWLCPHIYVGTHENYCRQEALREVKVPVEVRQLLADLRTHLREKLEPPVYVSDRRLVKAVGLMQVSMQPHFAFVCLFDVLITGHTGSHHCAASSCVS